MSRSRLYDVYIKEEGFWKHYLRTFFPLSKHDYAEKGFIAKILPCRQWAYTGYNSRVWIKKCYNDGCSSGFWRVVESMLQKGN